MGSRILVVEDSAVIRRLIEVCLRAADLEIITRDDGKNGLAAVGTDLAPSAVEGGGALMAALALVVTSADGRTTVVFGLSIRRLW